MHQLPPVGLPCSDRILRAHRQMNTVDHDRVPILRPPSTIPTRRRTPSATRSVEQARVVGRVVLLLEACRETEVGELDVALGVNEDVVRLDVSEEKQESRVVSKQTNTRLAAEENAPVDETELVDCLDGKDALGHVELGDVLREGVVLDEPEIAHNKGLVSIPETEGGRKDD